MANVLVVDDDERLLGLLVRFLEVSGYFAKGAKSAKEARLLLSNMPFDLIVVDWMMPVESGIEFTKSLKAETSCYRHIPVMMLTALDDIQNKLDGFDAGADDYLTKPFDERELVARLKAIQKRQNTEKSTRINFGECSFDMTTGELRRSGENVYLTSSEIVLLKTLCQNPNHPFSREELAKKLGFVVNNRTVDVQITRLRKKIKDNPKTPSIIQTVRHIGYAISI